MLVDPRLQDLAVALAAARDDGGTVAVPDFDLSLDEAYAVQDEIARLRGGRQMAWKVGSTSAAAQARLGTDRPGAGPILDRDLYRSGDLLPICDAHDVHVEVEFAFRLGRALPARQVAYEVDEVRAAVDAFVPALELVGSRFASGLAGSGRSLVTADGGASIALVTGAAVPLPDGWQPAAHPCMLVLDGVQAASGDGGRALGDPLAVLTWLANHLRERGPGLSASALVSTGTCTGLVAVRPGQHLCGDFGDMGAVEVRLGELSRRQARVPQGEAEPRRGRAMDVQEGER